MDKPWYKTENDFEAQNHAVDLWTQQNEELREGEFWADRIRKYKGEPAKQLRRALDNLPLPAAFKKAAIATRAIIRENRKSKEKYDDELALLYWLAAINSFSIPYSKVLKEPGYNVMVSIPAKMLNGLAFSYNEIGYQRLELLNKTDIKWFVSHWGEPDSHTTLHDNHIDLWKEYENKLKAKRDKDNQSFLHEINRLDFNIGNTKSESKTHSRSSKWLIGAVLLFVIIFFIIAAQMKK